MEMALLIRPKLIGFLSEDEGNLVSESFALLTLYELNPD
jgi:hypothetical protein